MLSEILEAIASIKMKKRAIKEQELLEIKV